MGCVVCGVFGVVCVFGLCVMCDVCVVYGGVCGVVCVSVVCVHCVFVCVFVCVL